MNNYSNVLFHAWLAAELPVSYRFILVDFRSGWQRCVDHYIVHGEFSKYKSGTGKPGEEFENRVIELRPACRQAGFFDQRDYEEIWIP